MLMDINFHTIHIMQHTTIPTAYRIARLCQFRRETSFLHFKKSGKEGINNLLHFYKLTLNRQKAKQQKTKMKTGNRGCLQMYKLVFNMGSFSTNAPHVLCCIIYVSTGFTSSTALLI